MCSLISFLPKYKIMCIKLCNNVYHEQNQRQTWKTLRFGLTWSYQHRWSAECWSAAPDHIWQQHEEGCFQTYQCSRSPHLCAEEDASMSWVSFEDIDDHSSWSGLWERTVMLGFVTILDQNLRACEAPVHCGHMQRAFPFFILSTENKKTCLVKKMAYILTISTCSLNPLNIDYNPVSLNTFFEAHIY